jgi:hypothetical protein
MPHDAKEILKIRLPKADAKDFVSWKFENWGIFHVGVHTNWPSIKNGNHCKQ